MTAADRFERDLPMDLEDLARPHMPDYLTDILSRTATTRQRPAWTFPERWLPMADIASRPAFVPRMPMRVLAAALVILALLIAGAVFVGSRQTRLPPLFGPAGNGLIAYSQDGDIYVADPVSGVAKAIVTGPESDTYPDFSPDGRLIVFDRGTAFEGWNDLVVAEADGDNLRVITTEPYWQDSALAWAADSSALYRITDAGQLTRIDALHVAPPQVIAEGLDQDNPMIHPIDGRILYRPAGGGAGLWIMNADGTDGRPLIEPDPAFVADSDFEPIAWSPDGSRFMFLRTPADSVDERLIYVADADGTNIHALTNATGEWVEVDARWSPDGRSIAFNRWERVAGDWLVRAIGVAPADGGAVVDAGPVPVSEGAAFGYAPDGETIWSLPGPVGDDPAYDSTKALAIDPTDGSSTDRAWPTGVWPAWQRTALEP